MDRVVVNALVRVFHRLPEKAVHFPAFLIQRGQFDSRSKRRSESRWVESANRSESADWRYWWNSYFVKYSRDR